MLSRLGCAYLRFRLSQCRVRFSSHSLGFFQREQFRVPLLLCPSHLWIDHLHPMHLHVRVLRLFLRFIFRRHVWHLRHLLPLRKHACRKSCSTYHQHPNQKSPHVVSPVCHVLLRRFFCAPPPHPLCFWIRSCISSYSLSGNTRTIVIIPIIPALQFRGNPLVSGLATASSIAISMNASCGNPGTRFAFSDIGEWCTCSTPRLSESDCICCIAFSSVEFAV